MSLVHCAGPSVGDISKVDFETIRNQLSQVVVQLPLILLDRQQLITPLMDNGGGDLGLVANRTQRDDTPSQFQHVQERGNRPNLDRLGRNSHLPQRKTIGRGPHADHGGGQLAQHTIVGTTHFLAV